MALLFGLLQSIALLKVENDIHDLVRNILMRINYYVAEKLKML